MRMQDVPESQEQDAEPGSENEELAELSRSALKRLHDISQEIKDQKVQLG